MGVSQGRARQIKKKYKMSMVAAVDSYVLLDSKQYLDKVYRVCRLNNGCRVKLTCPTDIYAIFTPLRMDSEKVATADTNTVKRKRRKRKLTTDIFSEFNNIRPYITDCIHRLVPLGKELGFLRNSLREDETLSNNNEARQLSKKWMQDTSILDVTNTEDDGAPLRFYQYHGGVYDSEAATNAIVHFSGNEPRIIEINCNSYVLPAECSFFNSDINQLRKMLTIGKKFDVILLDPPWPNKSVKRKKNYHTLTLDNIKDMPIKELANDDCLVVTWITSNKSHLRYVQDVLYPSWGVSLTATWHWLKLTVMGEPVCSVDSPHKRPYEHILLGFVMGPNQKPPKSIENHKVFCSVPSSIHSQKPPLAELLKPYMVENAQCLELFARSLLPGWTSWGNQVLQFQNTKCFNISNDCNLLDQSSS